jgi:hypothetical protein
MKKLTLDVESVRVESFRTATAATPAPARAAEATPLCSGTTCLLQCLTAQPRCF